jgi:hypothetical protein
MAVWNIWRDLWRLLNNAIDSDCEAARNKQADDHEVQVLADRSRVAWWDEVGSTKGFYVHIMHDHLADIIGAGSGRSPPLSVTRLRAPTYSYIVSANSLRDT